ncbi:hypothetical protein H072_9079 [Dactylellina haptotyla CBS 200.50]|uniref:DUF7896 domain-containing protein n=1 Tax=Dactylellina haptotyla (strain CBS 200.50) TaxID=1284197 RepID=S8A872_DACHA|nr:hypothetical protein H072_9079 [Dactylellina haptotyla CBS 200.50]
MEAVSAGSVHDPVRQQVLRQLHQFLGHITNEMVQESGENYDRKKRDDRFYNSLRMLADHVVEFNGKQELARESASAPRATTAADFAGLRAMSSTALLSAQKPASVAPQPSELAGLPHALLPRGRRFSRPQMAPGTTVDPDVPALPPRPSVSPTTALEASFSSMTSLQSNSRAPSSESVPTVSAPSAPRSPAIANASGTHSGPTTLSNTSPVQQVKPSSNFGNLAMLRRKTATATLSQLQKAAISTTAEIEASLAAVTDFMAPPRETSSAQLKQSTASQQRSQPPPATQTSASNAAAFNSEVSDSTPNGRKRKRQKKQWCHLCDDHREGFRGPHELARHMNIQHQPKKTVFIVHDDSPGGNMFKDCKHCSRRKIYGQDYNAACHLRRAHFNKRSKTDTPEEREFKQMHPDFPPMEELRPWLRKCLVDVSKLRDRKYLDKQDEAILKVESAAKHVDSSSSDKDQDMSDYEQQPDGPATPPPESEVEPEVSNSKAKRDIVFEDLNPSEFDSMIHNNFGFDLDFNNTMESVGVEGMVQPEFTFNAPAAVPRTNHTPAIFAFQAQQMGLLGQMVPDEIPDFIGFQWTNSSANSIFDKMPHDNNLEFQSAPIFDSADYEQFLEGTSLN